VPVRIVLRRAEAGRLEIDLIDQGPGMTAEFVRDRLFRPLDTSKAAGSGIGAWQARELLREAGGELSVLTEPGRGTTMRLSVRAQEGPAAPAAGARNAEARRLSA